MSGGYLRRYTELPSLIYLLKEQKLTLLDPVSWEDRNDSFYLSTYREKRGFKTVLAPCFTSDSETYHHWSVYAPRPAGVCIEFKRNELVSTVESQPGIRTGAVDYPKLTHSRLMPPALDALPFTKRYAFRHETEFRVIYESATTRHNTFDIPVSLSLIARITLSPWLPPGLSDHVKGVLHAIPGCAQLGIVRSTLISNQEWRNLAEESV
jgi:hypothetical protein